MRNESNHLRAILKGHMFEVVIQELLKNNDFSIVQVLNNERIKMERNNFIEMKGRGAWHQIDCPFDYNRIIPFINPIRILGEVKFHSMPLTKSHIREFIGVIKDIQENYFIPDGYNNIFERVTEIGVFFAANGFDDEAERLAFAHNIKTISYKNNYIIDKIKKSIRNIESNHLSAKKCMSKIGRFVELFRQSIIDNNSYYMRELEEFVEGDGLFNRISELKALFIDIQTSFVASTSGGAFIHFVSNSRFPTYLFLNTDEANCEVYYSHRGDNLNFYLQFSEDREQRKFYFTPPKSLSYAAFYGGETVLNEKERLFKTIHVPIKLDGIQRNLTIKLNSDWLDHARRNV